MATKDNDPGFRKASTIVDPPTDVMIPDGSDSIKVCERCWAWTGHASDDEGAFHCLACEQRDVPECAECGEPAAVEVKVNFSWRPYCGRHGLDLAGGRSA